MRSSKAILGSRILAYGRALVGWFSRRTLRRRVVCGAISVNLLLLPGPGIIAEPVIALATNTINIRVASYSYQISFLQRLLSGLFSQSSTRRRRETMADRIATVARIRINPTKLVGYEEGVATFTATPTDVLDRTVQGVKFSWESSDTNKLEIDEAGRARFLQPGVVRITSRAGSVSASAPVLIRPNRRPRQTDAEWRVDQQRLTANGDVVGENGGKTESPRVSGLCSVH